MSHDPIAETSPDAGVASENQERRPVRRALDRLDRTTSVFIVLSLLFGGFFALAVPIGWGPDETAHFDRAYQVASGGFAPERLPDSDGLPQYGGRVPRSAVDLVRYAGPPRQYRGAWQPLVQQDPAFAAAASRPLDSPLVVTAFPNTAAYSPVAYLPAAAAVEIGRALDLSVGHTWTLMRLVQVLLYTVVAGVGVFALRRNPFRWVVLAVALLPTAVYQSGVVSADAVTNAVVLTYLALLTRVLMLTPRDDRPVARRWVLGIVLACALVLPLLKPTYAILLLLLLALPFTRRDEDGRRRVRRNLVVPVASVVVVAAVALLWWSRLSAGTADAMGWLRQPSQRHLVQPGNQLAFVLSHPVDAVGIGLRTLLTLDWSYVSSFFGQLGYAPGGNLSAPALGAVCTLVVVGLGLAYGTRRRIARWRTAGMTLVWLASVAAVFGTLYLAFSPLRLPIVTGVQGRYFVPLTVLLCAVLLQLLPRMRRVTPTALRRSEIAVFALCAAALVLAAVKYVTVMYVPGYHA
ncbi:DUF2142 domain-containing protein [Tersicoccus sp. MR15.9]|uniref:DUF2142 domain-containing protein n=1 Tax=Tersicoccus mangrovi TaxID=3121635 RepID=UPI002FE562DF